MSDFAAFWTSAHPTAPPVAHALRDAERSSWVRFHSLPQSKRYATSAREKDIVLERANTLATCVLGNDSPCWMILAVPHYPDEDEGAPSCMILGRHQLLFQSEYRPSDPDADCYRIFAGPVTWVSGSFDEIISKVANDELPPIMWASMTSGKAFAPYDGGTDLFLRQEGEAASLKRDFPEWLSARPDGF